jgi:hypothetical protein
MRKKILITIVLISILFAFIKLIFADNNIDKNNNNNQKNESYGINIQEYIYQNLKLKPEEYKFKTITYNEYGNIIYSYTIFKARGTLLININIPSNLIGYRILKDVKELSSISIGFDNTVLLNTLAGGNKFYYISLKGTTDFESPSFNTTKINSFPNGFYWLGFKYLNKNKKIDNNTQYLFIFQNQKIKDFPLTKINNKIKNPYNLVLINSNNAIIEKVNNIENKDLYIYNISDQELEQIEKQKNITLGNIFNNKLYYAIYDKKNSKLEVKSININNLNLIKEFEINLSNNSSNYFLTNFQKTNNYFLLNLLKNKNNIKTIIYNKDGQKVEDKENQQNFPILYELQNKNGYYYLYKEYIEIYPLK